jgi:hypothetical protein
MFYIDSKTQKPNHEFARERAQDWARRGFRFDAAAWRSLTDGAAERSDQLRQLGLENPDSPTQIEWFLRSFNSLEIAAQLYDLKRAKWDLTVDAISALVDKYAGVPELRILFEYKKIQAVARSFKSLERQLKDGGVAYPQVKLTSTNRIMFVEPYISGLPNVCRPLCPYDDDSVLVSVDITAQEPTIIANWYGSDNLRSISATESDIYTGVAKAAFIPRVKIGDGSVSKVRGGYWLWGTGDALKHIEDVHPSAASGAPPALVCGVFESGARRMLPVRWSGGRKDPIGELLPAALGFRLTPEQRQNVKDAWSILVYGGAKATAVSLCTSIDGVVLADYIKSEVKPLKFDDTGVSTYFGTPLQTDKNALSRALNNRAVQGTGADLMALLIEHFYSEPQPDGIDIYFTRYDEMIMQVSGGFIDSRGGGEGVGDYLRDIFGHKVDGFTPFMVDVRLVEAQVPEREVKYG